MPDSVVAVPTEARPYRLSLSVFSQCFYVLDFYFDLKIVHARTIFSATFGTAFITSTTKSFFFASFVVVDHAANKSADVEAAAVTQWITAINKFADGVSIQVSLAVCPPEAMRTVSFF